MTKLKWTAPLLALFLLACQSPIKYDYDARANYSSFKTFDWTTAKIKEPGRDTDNASSIMDRRVRQAIVHELEVRGFKQEKTADPDFLVTYYPIWKNRHVYTSHAIGMGWGGRAMGMGFRTRVGEVHAYREGSIVLEIVDSRSRELVWRAVAEGALSGEESPEDAEEVVAREVHRMLDKFPPRKRD